MEPHMSSYSFSHQFYNHWTNAPKLIRAAIVQELMDINTLLQPDTELTHFSFSELDLDAHIEALYSTHYRELSAAQAIADEQQRADEQRLKEEKAEAEAEAEAEENRKAEAKKMQEAEVIAADIQDNSKTASVSTTDHTMSDSSPEQEQEPQVTANTTVSDHLNDHDAPKNKVAENTSQSSPSKGQVNSNKDKVLSALQQHASTSTVKPTPITDTFTKAPILNQDHEALIYELGQHIDDYLSEQMAQLSEDLKSWLRSEISRKLSEQAPVAGSSDNKE